MVTPETTHPTLRERIARDGITMRATHLGRKVERQDGRDWMHDLWRCTLRLWDHAGPTFTTEFKQGTGHLGKRPTLESVLECLLDDSAGVENEPEFEDWARNYGYDPDSRKAEQIWIAVCTQRDRVKEWLRDGRYEAYLWETRRD